MTTRLLLTGYEPFDDEPINPSEQLVATLAADPPDDLELHAVVLPVDARVMPARLEQALRSARPHVVVSLGQAAGRPTVDLERTAFNALDFRGGADNGGLRARGEALHGGAPAALVSGLPLARWQRELADEGLPVGLSDDAGRHLCNALLYELLWRHVGVEAVFVHLPALPEQAARRGKGEPSLAPGETERCLRALLRRIAAR